nr:MAG TPA: hypothetical protein [Caudoviricetes sp.]
MDIITDILTVTYRYHFLKIRLWHKYNTKDSVYSRILLDIVECDRYYVSAFYLLIQFVGGCIFFWFAYVFCISNHNGNVTFCTDTIYADTSISIKSFNIHNLNVLISSAKIQN